MSTDVNDDTDCFGRPSDLLAFETGGQRFHIYWVNTDNDSFSLHDSQDLRRIINAVPKHAPRGVITGKLTWVNGEYLPPHTGHKYKVTIAKTKTMCDFKLVDVKRSRGL